jgi:uncharacterized membrane protein SirB2
MILGMTLSTFTIVHVLLSLVGIGSGLLVAYGLLLGKRFDGATAIFLATTALTSLTGFLFPFERLLTSHILGIISLVVLAVAIQARYARHLVGAWRSTYVVSAVLALFLNVFVLVAQIFMKVPAVHALAPTRTEPPFLVAQLLVLAVFIVLGIFAVKRFRIDPAAASYWGRSKAS